jgi:hypothetical protein
MTWKGGVSTDKTPAFTPEGVGTAGGESARERRGVDFATIIDFTRVSGNCGKEWKREETEKK